MSNETRLQTVLRGRAYVRRLQARQPQGPDVAELTALQALAVKLPSGAMHSLPDASTNTFLAPMRGKGFENTFAFANPSEMRVTFISANILGLIFTNVITGAIFGVLAGHFRTNFNLLGWGWTELILGLIGNVSILIPTLAYLSGYRRITRLNTLAFTRWLRVRYNTIVDPARLRPVRAVLNNEYALGQLGHTVLDVQGNPVTLLADARGGIKVTLNFEPQEAEPVTVKATVVKKKPVKRTPAVNDLFSSGEIGKKYKMVQTTLAQLAERDLDADSAHTVERVKEDVEDLKSTAQQLLELHPLTATQTKMLTSTLQALAKELNGVLAAASAALERALEIQYRYVQDRQGESANGLSLTKENGIPSTGV